MHSTGGSHSAARFYLMEDFTGE